MQTERPTTAAKAAALLLASGALTSSIVGCESTPDAEPGQVASAEGFPDPLADPLNPSFGEDPADASLSAPRTSTPDALVQQQIELLAKAMQDRTLTLESEPVNQAAAAPEANTAFLETAPPLANLGPAVTLGKEIDEDDAETDGERDAASDTAAEALAAPDELAEPVIPAQVSPQEEIDLLIDQLAAAIRRSGELDVSPVPSMARLAVLDLFTPGTFNTHHPVFESAADRVARALSDDDFAFLVAWRDLFTSLHVRLDDQGVDLDALAMTVEDLNLALDRWRPLAIANAELCTQVDGFGVYAPVRTFEGRYKFLAGRSHPVIVYAEIDNFGHRGATREATAGFEVELNQQLTLFHAGTPKVEPDTDLVAWRTESQQILDFSRRKRSDFFVVQIITLPKSLTVGSYRLKISIEDPITENRAEHVIDIDVVADLSAMNANVATVPTEGTGR